MNDKILISFRIDDVTFASEERQVIENAIRLANKFKITFNLAVIAERFDKNYSKELFQLYKKHMDVLEIIAHGLTHKNPIEPKLKGEFYSLPKYIPIPKKIQQNHIKKMKNIFIRHKLKKALQILALPWHSGDANTIKVAEKEGYKIMTQLPFVPNYELAFNGLIVSKSFVQGIPLTNKLTRRDISNAVKEFRRLLNAKQKFIQIYLHLPNFMPKNNTSKLIRAIINNSPNGAEFNFISRRI